MRLTSASNRLSRASSCTRLRISAARTACKRSEMHVCSWDTASATHWSTASTSSSALALACGLPVSQPPAPPMKDVHTQHQTRDIPRIGEGKEVAERSLGIGTYHHHHHAPGSVNVTEPKRSAIAWSAERCLLCSCCNSRTKSSRAVCFLVLSGRTLVGEGSANSA